MGTIATGERVIFTQGKLERSNGPFDLAIDGEGFFIVRDGPRVAYTRDGEFSRAADGTLRNADGWALDGVRPPPEAVSAKVAQDGTLSVMSEGGTTRTAGKVLLATFAAPERLKALGGTLSSQTNIPVRPACCMLAQTARRRFASGCWSVRTLQSSSR